MKQHNDRIKPIASITLQPEDTVGASINWYLTHRPVPTEVLATAFEREGLNVNTLPNATSGVARFRELCAYVNQRIYRRDAVTRTRREFVASQVKHTGDDAKLVSFAYSANFGGGTEKTRLVQIGTLTYNTDIDEFSWRFEADRKSKGETDENYLDRCLASMPDFGRADLAFFESFAIGVLDEVNEYVTTSSYDAIKLRDTLRAQFIAAGCYSLSARGGFWFAPRVGEDGGPADVTARIMRAYESADPNNRFLLLTMPKDAATVAAAATVVEEGLMARVAEVEASIDSITAQTRAGQHTTRLAELAAVVQQADLYRELLGLTTDGLQAKIDAVRAIIDTQAQGYANEVLARTQAAEAKAAADKAAKAEAKAAKAEPAPLPLPSIAPVAALTANFLRKAVSAAKAGAADIVVEGLTLHIDTDPTLGFIFHVNAADGRPVRTGMASTQKGLVETIRALAD